jgi:hypothetical protein
MATTPPTTVANPSALGEYDRVNRKAWTLGAGDDGAPVTLPNHADRSIQVSGTFSGATLTLQNTIDGSNWLTLRDVHNDTMSFTSAPTYTPVISPATLSIRPIVSGGDGSTAITVTILAKG